MSNLLKNIWYAAARSTQITAGKLLARKLLDEPIVLWRNNAGTLPRSVAVALTLTTVGSKACAERPPENIYRQTCALCHELPPVGPTLRGRQWPVAAIEVLVRSGLNGMPAFRFTEISDAELHSLARYVTELPKTPRQTP